MVKTGLARSTILADILDVVYQDAMAAERLRQVMDIVGKVMPFDSSVAFRYDAGSKHPRELALPGGNADLTHGYIEYYWSVDEIAKAAWEQKCLVCRPTDVISASDWAGSELYNEFLLQRDCNHIVAAVLPVAEPETMSIHFARADRSNPFSDDDVVFLEILQPMLTKAFARKKQIDDAERVFSAIRQGFDLIPGAVYLIDTNLQFVHMNQEAIELIDSSEGQSIRDFVISAVEQTTARDRDAHPRSPSACEFLGRKMQVMSFFIPSDSAPLYYVQLIDGQREMMGLVERLARKFDLSSRESEMCGLILHGNSNREIAGVLNISELTVKDHLKSIFHKLDVSSRSEVARRILFSA